MSFPEPGADTVTRMTKLSGSTSMCMLFTDTVERQARVIFCGTLGMQSRAQQLCMCVLHIRSI